LRDEVVFIDFILLLLEVIWFLKVMVIVIGLYLHVFRLLLLGDLNFRALFRVIFVWSSSTALPDVFPSASLFFGFLCNFLAISVHSPSGSSGSFEFSRPFLFVIVLIFVLIFVVVLPAFRH
jgi:hypothetical protein